MPVDSNSTPSGITSAPAPGLSKHFEPGELVAGRYKVLSVIAAGGYGCVYKVHQVLLKKDMALKTLNPIVASEATLLRLRQEAQLVSKLNHPNLVKAVDFAFIDGVQPFLVMEFVDGPTLSTYLAEKTRLEVEETLQIFIPLCLALSYAHDQGIVHRDIKPGNVILAKDEKDPFRLMPKIVDFGIAKLSMGDASLTGTGDIFGTPLYMSPEQCDGLQVDSRSDIYSLGCVLFEALTGAPPFRGNAPLETMMQHKSAVPLTLKQASLGVEFPRGLEKCVAKMLAKEPRDRYQNLLDAANDLKLIQSGQDHRTQATSLTPDVLRADEKRTRKQHLFGLAATCAVIGAVCGSFATFVHFTTTESKQKLSAPAKEIYSRMIPEEVEQAQGYFSSDDKLGAFAPFRFSKQYSLGRLYCWLPNGQVEIKEAKGQLQIPRQSRIVFACLDDMFGVPFYWGRFHTEDLAGAIMRPHRITQDLSERDNEDIAVDLVTRQRKLQLLALNRILMSRRTLDMVGELPNLRWLELSEVNFLETNDKNYLAGKDIARLANLSQLSTIKISSSFDPLPALKAFQSCDRLKRLSVADTGISKLEELQALHAVKSLDTLDLSCNTRYPWDLLPQSKDLKRLAIEYHPAFYKPQFLRQFPRLTELVLINPTDEPWNENEKKTLRQQLKSVLPSGFNIEKNLSFIKEHDLGTPREDWFAPDKVDPYKL